METLVCRKYCSFYKPETKETKCGTYSFLERNLSPGEIRRAAALIPSECDRSQDGAIRELICERCQYRADGCDYVQGLDSPPCGGYTVVEHLLKSSTLLLGRQA